MCRRGLIYRFTSLDYRNFMGVINILKGFLGEFHPRRTSQGDTLWCDKIKGRTIKNTGTASIGRLRASRLRRGSVNEAPWRLYLWYRAIKGQGSLEDRAFDSQLKGSGFKSQCPQPSLSQGFTEQGALTPTGSLNDLNSHSSCFGWKCLPKAEIVVNIMWWWAGNQNVRPETKQEWHDKQRYVQRTAIRQYILTWQWSLLNSIFPQRQEL